MKLGLIPVVHQMLNRTLPLLEPKKEGVKRIITIGDSITEGACSSDEKTKSYPS
jgi:hypothetical protein